MKPICIEMSAFGPYKDKIEIDFTKVGENGIFLITGDTGAGKTTIFDAIVFALFGEVSGSNRQVSSIRSDFSDANVETYVILTFKHKEKVYTIRRNPQYERARKNGDGLVKNIADASIEFDDKIISGVNNVNTKVEEILGINAKQFKQISMLAQGEFLKILFAESKDRTEIFRRIFDTDIYNNITYMLRNKRRENEEKLSSLKTSFITNTQNIRWTDEKDLVNIQSEKELNQIDIKDILERLKKDIELKEKDEKNIEKKLEEVEKEYKEIEEKIKKIEEQNRQIDRLEGLNREADRLKEQEENMKNEQKLIDINQKIKEKINPIEEALKKSKEELEEKKKLTEKEIKKCEKLKNNEKELVKKEEKIKELKQKLDEYNNNLDKYNSILKEITKISEINLKIEARENVIQELENIEKKKIKLNELKLALEKYPQSNKNIEEIKKELNKINDIIKNLAEKKELAEKYEKINKELKIISEKYNEEEDKFFREQAGILAEKLEENKPCPVCGSTSHPHIAQKRDIVLSKEELEKLGEKRDKKNQENETLKNQITGINKTIETLEKDINKGKDLSVEEYKKEIEKKLKNEQKEHKNIIETASNLYYELEEKILNIDEFKIDEYKEQFENKKQEKMNNKTTYDTIINEFINSVKKQDEEFDIKEYSSRIKKEYEERKNTNDKITKEINKIYYEITSKNIDLENFIYEEFKDQFDKRRTEQLKDITTSNTLISQYEKDIEEKTKETEELNKKYENSYKTLGYENYEEYKKDVLEEKEIKQKQEKIKEYNKQTIAINATIDEISKTLKTKEKIDVKDLKKEINGKSIILKNTKDEQIEFKGNLDNNKKIQNLLKKNSDELLKQIELYLNYDELYKTASGTLTGKKKIEFEQYVQAAYFDMIIVEANKRLVKMTDNRYLLIRKESSDKIKDKIGLDLEVIDNYNGKKRDVKSLSGGESFKAALALSLGVSDIIQSYSGGVVVDTLFIDEGFGSLDTESREQAINTLNLLTDNNKLIGIISHVTELKERLDKKIIIEKTSEGSKIRFEI